MYRKTLLLATMAALLASGSIAWGQGLLDKVERALDRAAPPQNGATPPTDSALPPPSGLNDLPPPPEAAPPTSGYLGVALEEAAGGGIAIVEIAPNSPAVKAGLKVGDKITSANKAAVKDVEELGTLMAAVPPGGKLTLGVQRAGKEMTIVATLSEPPASEPGEAAPAERPGIGLDSPLGPGAGNLPPPSVPGPAAPRASATTGRASLGVTVVTYDESRRSSDVPVRRGALITQIRPQSPADRAGLPLDGVIVTYDGQAINTADELVAAIAGSRPGDDVEISYYLGNKLSRKDVKLVAAADPSLLAPGTGGVLRDRPLLNRMERAIEGLTRPGAAPGDPSAIAPASPAPAEADSATLREEVELLKARIEALEARLKELETKLTPEAPAPGAAAAPASDLPAPAAAPPPAQEDEPAPTLKLPTRRPSTKAPKAKVGDG